MFYKLETENCSTFFRVGTEMITKISIGFDIENRRSFLCSVFNNDNFCIDKKAVSISESEWSNAAEIFKGVFYLADAEV